MDYDDGYDYALERARREERRPRNPSQPPLPGTPSILARVASVPVGPLKFFRFDPATILGNETEGGTATFSHRNGTSVAALIGDGSLSVGDYVVCHHVDYRWVTVVRGGCTFCIVPQHSCSPNPSLAGVTITLSRDGEEVASCTSSGVIIGVTRTAAGSGYTNGTGYTLGFSGGGGMGAAGTFDVVGGQVTNLRLTSGGSGYNSNPTISFAAAGGGSGATVAVTRRNQCCFADLPSGTYDLTASASGFRTATTTISTSPCTTKFISMLSNATVRVNVDACNGGISGGMSVAVIQGGVTIATGTTGSDRNVTFSIPAGIQTTFVATDTVYGRLATTSMTSGAGGFGGCVTSFLGILMEPAAGYRCFPAPGLFTSACGVPASETLQLNDSRYGPCTLTYDPGDQAWSGSAGGRTYRLARSGNPFNPMAPSFRYNGCEAIFNNAGNLTIQSCPPSLVCTIGSISRSICGGVDWFVGDFFTITE